jgi:predicted ATPase
MRPHGIPPYLTSVSLNKSEIKDMEQFPFNLPVVQSLDRLDISAAMTIFVGENGSGKSTLVEAIAQVAGFNAEGGTKNFNFATRPSESELHEHLRVGRGPSREVDGFFLRAESFYNVATQIEELGVTRSYGGKTLHAMSHGESFLALVGNRFDKSSLFILDEPEAALSPQGQITLIAMLIKLVEQGYSQVIMATHSPMLLAFPNAVIYELSERGIERVAFEDTEHYKLFSSFVKDPEAFIRRIRI